MEVVPIRWQGTSRIKSVRERVLAQSRAWLDQWAATPGPIECTVDCLPEQRSVDATCGDHWFSMSVPNGSMWWRVAPIALEQLGCCLAGVRVGDDQGLSAGIGRRALSDLAMQLAGCANAGDLKDAVPPAGSRIERRHGVAAFSLTVGDAGFELHLDAALCEAMVPSVASLPTDLTPRSAAILPAEVTLHAMLDLGCASLEDALVLRPGEVIRTAVALSQPVCVQSPSGETVFVGALVAHEGHRALRIISRA